MIKSVIKIGDYSQDYSVTRSRVPLWHIFAGFGMVDLDPKEAGVFHEEKMIKLDGDKATPMHLVGHWADTVIIYCEEKYWEKFHDVILGICTEKYCKIYLTDNGQCIQTVRG